MIQTKLLYDDPLDLDGFRILITRRWPRGKSFEGLQLDMNVKHLAPSVALLKEYKGNGTEINFPIFEDKFIKELDLNPKAQRWLNFLAKIAAHRNVTLLCYEQHGEDCHRYVVAKLLAQRLQRVL